MDCESVSLALDSHLILTHQSMIMETLNTIEKITLLVSVCIVTAILLSVLHSEKISNKSLTQFISNMKNICYITCLIVFLSSCSGTKFLNRKYTSGKFFENKNLVSKPKVTNSNHQILVDSSNIFSDKISLTKGDSILLTTSIIDTACQNKESEVLNKKQSYSNIIKHNTIFADTNKQYCSAKNEIKIIESQQIISNKKIYKNSLKRVKQYSNESFWSYLFGELGKTFLEALLIAGIVVFITWLAYTFFAPTTLFWLLLILTLTVIAITTYLVKQIKKSPKSKVNKSEVFDKIIAGLGQGALMVFELAFSIILSA